MLWPETGLPWVSLSPNMRNLNEALLYDVCQEMYFQWAKIALYVAEFREKMNLPEWMRSIERVVNGSAGGVTRVETMRRNLDAIAKLRGVKNT